MRLHLHRIWLVVLVLLVAGAAGPVQAQYEPAKLPDPSRRWSANMTVRSEYDDNVFTSSGEKTGSFKAVARPELLLNIPGDEHFLGLRYGYRATWYENRPGDTVDMEHTLDLLYSHTFNPRLVLDINNKFRYASEPELVDIESGQPVEVRRRGDYYFNNLNSKLTYNLSRRWQMSVAPSWQFYEYRDDTLTTNIVAGTTNTLTVSDSRNVYSGTTSLIYLLSPRTSTGGNYRFERVDYDEAGAGSQRNSDSHIVYASLVHRFNPQLNGQLSAGAELRQFDDEGDDTGPFVDSSLSYSYAPQSAVSGGVRFNLTTSDVAGYRSADNLSIFGRVNHAFTPKLSGGFRVVFAMSSYQNAPPGIGLPETLEDDVLVLGADVRYAFTRWFSTDLGYTYEEEFADPAIPGRDFNRNRVYVGATVTY